jgi:hypothetical protein
LFFIFPSPIWAKLWNSFDIIEVHCKDLCKLLHIEGPNSHNKALQQPKGVISVWLLDFLQ